jgi:hypothetical protein
MSGRTHRSEEKIRDAYWIGIMDATTFLAKGMFVTLAKNAQLPENELL